MDRKEFKRIWIPLTPDFYRLAFLILKSEADAQDLIQDLYIKLWNSREGLAEIKNPKGYGLTLTRNMCIDRIRKNGRTAGLDSQDNVSGDSNPEKSLNDRQMVILLQDAVASLPEEQRNIVQLKFFEDRSYDEIAQKTGLSPANVRVMVCRARDKIRKHMKSY